MHTIHHLRGIPTCVASTTEHLTLQYTTISFDAMRTLQIHRCMCCWYVVASSHRPCNRGNAVVGMTYMYGERSVLIASV